MPRAAAWFLWALGTASLLVLAVGLQHDAPSATWALAAGLAIVVVSLAEIEIEGVLTRFVLTNFLLAAAVGVYDVATASLAVLVAAVVEQLVVHAHRPTWRRVVLGFVSSVENGAVAVLGALACHAAGVHDPVAIVVVAYVALLANDAFVSPIGARLLGAPRTPLRAAIRVNGLALGVDLAGGLPLALVAVWAGMEHPVAPLVLAVPVVVTSRLTSRAEHLKAAVEHAGLDTLTGLPARRRFEQLALGEISHARRFGHGVTLVFGDVDHFKRINDAGGHAAGDLALRRIADALSGTARRSTDVVCRWGGEEFAVLAPSVRRDEGVLLAERLRLAVEHGLADLGVTMSFGVAEWLSVDGPQVGPPTTDDATVLAGLLERADSALYAAKHAGRNAVWSDGDGNGPVRTSLAVSRS
jgi:diguanylate cyclase (GGDEF)-like protein